ncbi:MAG: STAS domain-containing protein [Oscillospiraceae bacterium]|nr:STAS domain-containing protein [Oscillospiraceae bacterium]
MDISTTRDGDSVTIGISGKLDSLTSPKLTEALAAVLEGGAKSIRIDFGGVTFISSAGLRVLLQGERNAKKEGVRQVLVNVTEAIMDVFEMTGFTVLLNIN